MSMIVKSTESYPFPEPRGHLSFDTHGTYSASGAIASVKIREGAIYPSVLTASLNPSSFAMPRPKEPRLNGSIPR